MITSKYITIYYAPTINGRYKKGIEYCYTVYYKENNIIRYKEFQIGKEQDATNFARQLENEHNNSI